MPTVKLPNIQKGATLEEDVRILTDSFLKLRRELEYALHNLDADNVMTAKGVISDWVYTGTLTADQINVIEGINLDSSAIIQWTSIENAPYVPDDSHITTIAANYVATPNLITDIAQVHDTLNLGSIDTDGQITFRWGSTISATNGTFGPQMEFSSDTFWFENGSVEFGAATAVNFGGTTVDFTGATVTGLTTTVTAKFA